MIKRGSEIIGLPVICLDEGCRIMEVKDLIYNEVEYALVAFVVEEGKYLHEKKIIQFEKVKSIGEDAVIVQDKISIEKVRNNLSNFYSHCTNNSLLGLEIVTDDGNNVGAIQDIIIDCTTGRLVGIIITEGLFDDLIEGRPILPIQENLNLNQSTLIISNSMSQSIIHHTGGLRKMISFE